MTRHPRTLHDLQIEERLGLIFRRDPGSEFLLTECGEWLINAYYPNKTTHVSRSKDYAYLRMDGQNIHVMMARTWCYNPSPNNFRIVDHIDGDTQNNHASNLRWVDHCLNALNKKRKLAYKVVSKRKSGTVHVYYRSKVMSKGVDYSSSHSRKKEAELKTGLKLNELFSEHYNATVKSATPPPRADHLYYWADNPNAATSRYSLSDSGDERPCSGREEVPGVPDSCRSTEGAPLLQNPQKVSTKINAPQDKND